MCGQFGKKIINYAFDPKNNYSCKDLKKEIAREMSRSGKVSRTFEFLRFFGAAEKIQAKVGANSTGFSAEIFGSQSVQIFCFARKTIIQMLISSCRSLTSLEHSFSQSLPNDT